MLILAPNGDGSDGVDLDELAGCHIRTVEYGFPAVREVAEPRADADGETDLTRNFGARAVTVEGVLAMGRAQACLDAIAPYAAPGQRSWLINEFDDGSVRRIAVRGADGGAVQEAGPNNLQVQFKAPAGILESVTEHRRWLIPVGDSEGRSYPLTHPRSYPAASGSDLEITNHGSVDADWVCRIYGPITNPRIIEARTGGQVALKATIVAGDMVQVASIDRSILAMGSPGAYRWQYLDYARTRWFRLPRGASNIYLVADSHTLPATAEIVWRDAYLL